MQPNYKINMVMNNNVVLAINMQNNNEVVLLGKGIGFGKKKDAEVYFSNEVIERSFINLSQSLKKDYYQLIQQMDIRVMGLCEEIILMAEKAIGELNDSIHIVLTDHIGFAIERIKLDMVISNPFLHEIKILYAAEFKLALEVIEKIKINLNVELPEEEAAFIALHLHSARKNKEVKKTLKNTRVIKAIVTLLEESLGADIINQSLTYRRLLTHIRGSIDRLEQNITLENPLLDRIKVDFKEAWLLAVKAKIIIEENLEIEVNEDEIGYLAIHIDRLIRLKSKRVTD